MIIVLSLLATALSVTTIYLNWRIYRKLKSAQSQLDLIRYGDNPRPKGN